MNNMERRQLARANVIDASIARTAVNESRRHRKEAAVRLRKDMAAKSFSSRSIDTIAYPFKEVG